jgi:heat shock protein HslJ
MTQHGMKQRGTKQLVAGSAVLALALVLVACSPTGSPAGSPSPGGSDPGSGIGLAGSWVLVEGTGPAGPIVLVDDWRITMLIQGSEVGGNACNHYGGTLAVAGNALRITELFTTDMACEPQAVMDAEAAYGAALTAATRWVREGDTLTLSGPDVMLRYEIVPPVPAEDIVGTAWRLDTLITGEAASSVQGTPTLVLGADGSLSGSTGCRDLTGRYVLAGDEVQVTQLAADGECPAELAQQDDLVVSVLGDGFTATVEGRALTLVADGGIGLVYHAPEE